jgi:hypothetical protein
MPRSIIWTVPRAMPSHRRSRRRGPPRAHSATMPSAPISWAQTSSRVCPCTVPPAVSAPRLTGEVGEVQPQVVRRGLPAGAVALARLVEVVAGPEVRHHEAHAQAPPALASTSHSIATSSEQWRAVVLGPPRARWGIGWAATTGRCGRPPESWCFAASWVTAAARSSAKAPRSVGERKAISVSTESVESLVESSSRASAPTSWMSRGDVARRQAVVRAGGIAGRRAERGGETTNELAGATGSRSVRPPWRRVGASGGGRGTRAGAAGS